MMYRTAITDLSNPFDVLARVRNAITRRGIKWGITIAASLIIIDDAENQIYTDYPCKCGASQFDCKCNSPYANSRHFGQYTPNMNHIRHNQ